MATTNQEGAEETHESWGMLQISRVQGHSKPLYGSSIRHDNTIRITVCRGSKNRHLNSDWYHAGRELIEIEMSPVQWAEAITHMNCGNGTPATILHVQGKQMADCPETNERVRIQDEFEGDMKEMADRFEKSSSRVRELLAKKGSLTVAEKNEIAGVIDSVRRTLHDTIPFTHTQWNEVVEKTVTQAKGEIESFYTHAVMNAGKAALGIGYESPVVPLLESDKKEN